MKMIDKCEFYGWSMSITENNAVVMSWCQYPNEGTAIGYDLDAKSFCRLGDMFIKHAKEMAKEEKEKAKLEKGEQDKKDKA